MYFTDAEEENPYHIFNICASTKTDSVASCIDNVICPPESVYYAAEYIRLQSEIDKWKEIAKDLETQLKGKVIGNEHTQTQISKETELQLQDKFNKEKEKVAEFYEIEIKLLHQQNRKLERKNHEDLKSIETLTEQLKIANINIKKHTSKNKNLQVKLTELERSIHVNSSQIANSTENNSTHHFTNAEDSTTDEHIIAYQPLSSPVTPIETDNHERISVITHGSKVTRCNSTFKTRSTVPSSSSIDSKEHRQVIASISPEADLQSYLCSCGRKYNVKDSLTNHISRMKNGKVFCCRICKDGFIWHASLKRHYKKRHGIEYQHGKFGCGYCGKTFSNVKLLRQHKMIEHERRN